MAKYNNLKDVFFDSKFHVGRGMATYDTSLDKTTFDGLQDINAVVNNEVAMNSVINSEKSLNTILNSNVAISAASNSVIAKDSLDNAGIIIDFDNSPGNKRAIAGTRDEGYFGAVPSSELITGDVLASVVGISTGTSQFSDAGWLKFTWKGNVEFVAKKPIRHSISWDSINTAGCVFGTKTVVIGGLTYKVRLMRAGTVDPMTGYNGTNNHGSEWNRLMLPIHIEAKDKSWAHPNNVESDIPYWGIDFTDGDLHTHNSFGSGSYSWCQETHTSYRLYRGNIGVSNSNSSTSSSASTHYGWRPVLELVP